MPYWLRIVRTISITSIANTGVEPPAAAVQILLLLAHPGSLQRQSHAVLHIVSVLAGDPFSKGFESLLLAVEEALCEPLAPYDPVTSLSSRLSQAPGLAAALDCLFHRPAYADPISAPLFPFCDPLCGPLHLRHQCHVSQSLRTHVWKHGMAATALVPVCQHCFTEPSCCGVVDARRERCCVLHAMNMCDCAGHAMSWSCRVFLPSERVNCDGSPLCNTSGLGASQAIRPRCDHHMLLKQWMAHMLLVNLLMFSAQKADPSGILLVVGQATGYSLVHVR